MFAKIGAWLALLVAAVSAGAADYVAVPGASLRSVLPPDGQSAPANVAAFRLRTLPVTNGEFLAFVRAHPEWRRDRVAKVFADRSYLRHWARADALGAAARAAQPVTYVSWFAANAYCKSENARLPSWHEWELSAAADASRTDAREDPAWRAKILSWYSRPSNDTLLPVGKTPANVYGAYDLHGLVWEWVEDFSGLMVSVDSREQGDPDLQKFCGAGALSMQDRENYAVLMRVAMLSSLQATYATSNLGFRCARSVPGASP